MIPEDYLVRAISKDAGVIALACITTQLANDGAQRHKTRPTAGAVLAQGLTAASLLGALLKVKQRVAVKLEGNGPIKKIVVESNAYGRIRGYVAVPDIDLPSQFGLPDIAGAVGNEGLVTVVKDLRGGGLYEGIVPLVDGSVDRDLLHYLHRSEQVQSLLDIDVLVEHADPARQLQAAGGLLIQALPDVDEKRFKALALRFDELPPFAQELKNGFSPEQILADALVGIEYDILEKRPLSFSCSCSWERTEKALLTLGRTGLESLLADGEAVVDCHFCREQYVFGQEALETIIDKL